MEAPNASNRKSIRAAEKAARIRDRERREIITQIMVSSPGRAWLWDRLSECNIFSTTHTADPYASAFQEGRRSVGLSLLADIMAYCPDQFIQAMREQNERHIRPDPDSNPLTDPPAERRGSPIADGGDSGALADSEADDPGSEAPSYGSPGHDIYVEAPRS